MFTKSQNLYLKTWREQSVQNANWGETWNWICPESLNVVASHFLEINLPALGNGNYKAVPGLYCVNTIKLLSNGSEVYELDYKTYIREFLSSMRDTEEFTDFVNCYLGGSAATGTARTVSIPLMLPNSHYLRRHSNRSYGCFPHRLSSKLEFQITMGTVSDVKEAGAADPASISGAAKVVTREIKGDSNAITRKYSDARGVYSICVPRYQTIIPWTEAAANTLQSVKATLPTGSVYEIVFEAYPSGTSLAETDRLTVTTPDIIRVQCDGEYVRVLDNKVRCEQELFANGFRTNASCNNAGRVCFADQAAYSDHCYQGAIHCGNISSITIEVQFGAAVNYRALAKKYSKVRIQSNGVLRSSLE